jgi:hypothetical protein
LAVGKVLVGWFDTRITSKHQSNRNGASENPQSFFSELAILKITCNRQNAGEAELNH